MHLALAAVLEFHKKMKQTIGDPRNPDLQPDQEFRMDLIYEELEELSEAVDQNDVVATADALGDLIYVLTGAAVTWGIDIASVFDEIHRSNMTKKPSNRREDGKILKDKDFSPPDIQGVLDEVAESFDSGALGEDGWWEEPTTSKRVGLEELDPPPVSKELKTAAAMKSIKEDFLPGVQSNGLTKDGRPYTVNTKALEELSDENYPLQDPQSWTRCVRCGRGLSRSNGCPDKCRPDEQGYITSYGAFVFTCKYCGRLHAVQAKLGTRGGLAEKSSCECMCGKAYTVDFTTKEPTVQETVKGNG